MEDPSIKIQAGLADNPLLKRKSKELEQSNKRSRQIEAGLIHAKAELELIFDTVPDLIALIDTNHRIIRTNRSMAERLGATPKQTVGCFCYEVVHGLSAPPDFCPHAKLMNSGKSESAEVTEERLGGIFDVCTTPLHDDAGRLVGSVHVSRDITCSKTLEKEIQLHSVIMANLAEGILLIRAGDGAIVFTNPQFEAMFGYGPGELVGKNVSTVNAPTQLSPEETAKKIIASLNKNNMWSGEIESIKKDGSTFWCFASVTTFEHPDYGNVWVSVHTDITERKQAEEELRESQAKYYDLYENAPDMYYTVDLTTGTIKECNRTFLRKTGYSKADLIGRTIFELYDSDSIEEAINIFEQFPVLGEVNDAERRVKCKDGRIIDVSLNVSAIRDKNGNITYGRSIWRDITERKEQEETIRTLSITDQLTGLCNRRGFTALAEQQLRVAERTRTGILLLFADVDNLKQINDRLGHKSGDEALVETANILREVFRKMDIIARIGGDEFAVLASEASLEYAGIIRNRLQDRLNNHNSNARRDYNLSLSIGIVYHPPPPPYSLDELISRADSLMYEEKQRKVPVKPHEGKHI